MKRYSRCCLFLMLLLLLSVETLADRGRNGRGPKRVTHFYFFGNSYTKFNTLMARVKWLYKAGLPKEDRQGLKIETPSRCPGGASFHQHAQWMQKQADNPKVPDFQAKDYRWVILQEQSLIPGIPQYRQHSAISANFLVQKAHEGTAQVMFFMTWGRRQGWKGYGMDYPDFLQHNAALLVGYLECVKTTSTPQRPTYLAPVGLVFETIYKDCVQRGEDPLDKQSLFFRLYNKDGSHPSILGTYAAALTIATSMTGYNPMYHPIDPQQAHAEEFLAIQDAVSRTILDTFNSGRIPYPWDTTWDRQPKQNGTEGTCPAPSTLQLDLTTDKDTCGESELQANL